MSKTLGTILFLATYYIGYTLLYLGIVAITASGLSLLAVLGVSFGILWCFISGIISAKADIEGSHYWIMLVFAMMSAMIVIPRLVA